MIDLFFIDPELSTKTVIAVLFNWTLVFIFLGFVIPHCLCTCTSLIMRSINESRNNSIKHYLNVLETIDDERATELIKKFGTVFSSILPSNINRN